MGFSKCGGKYIFCVKNLVRRFIMSCVNVFIGRDDIRECFLWSRYGCCK